MDFASYARPFTGDFNAEGKRLLGDQVRLYGQLQEGMAQGGDRATFQDNLRRFYRLAVRSGVKDLAARADPHAPWIAETVSSLIGDGAVADIGCCSGFFTVFYALNHPTSHFVGIDLSEDALEQAAQRAQDYGAQNVRWVAGDALEPAMDDTLAGAGTIILQDTLYQLVDPPRDASNILERFAPRQHAGSIVILADLERRLHVQAASQPWYDLDREAGNVAFDRQLGESVAYHVAVFRRRARHASRGDRKRS